MKKQEKGINRWSALVARAPQAFKKARATSPPQRFTASPSGNSKAETPDSTETSSNQQSTI
jgi:hypothetical protein